MIFPVALTRAATVMTLALLSVTPAVAQPRPTPARATFAQLSREAAAARDAGRADEAIALYRRALAVRPTWDEGQWYLGTLLYEQARWSEARAAFAQVLRVHAEHAGAVAMTGLCTFQLGDHDRALRSLLKARALHIQNTPELATVVRYHTGILLTRFGEYEAANQVLVELAAEGQDGPQTVEAFGVNLLRMPMLPSEVPAEARPRVQLAGEAGVAMATRQVARATALVERLAAEYPTTPNVHYVWGVLLLAEAPSRALDLFRKELEVSPQHVPARLQLAYELVKQGDAAGARPYAEEAARIAPRDFSPHLALGQVHLGLGDTAAAVREIEQATQLAPGSAQAHYLLSVAYARAGRAADAERARQAFTRLGGGTANR